MAQLRHHKSTTRRAEMVRAIVARYYEAGNQQRCYKAVWARYVNPIYPMCYRTFLNYLNIKTPPPPSRPTPLQMSLFDYLDSDSHL